MTHQTIEQAVEEFGNQFDELNMKSPKNSMPGLERELLKDFMRKSLQAQRDAGAKEERENIIEIVKFTKFRDTQPQEPYHKYLQQAKGVDYIRNKILKALTPPTK